MGRGAKVVPDTNQGKRMGNNDNSIPKEKPFGNFIIRLKELESFEGNQNINSVEAIVDEAFKSYLTISIEDKEKRYYKEERQVLLDEICELQKKGVVK